MEFIINTSDTERYNRQLEAVNKWYNNIVMGKTGFDRNCFGLYLHAEDKY